MLIIDNTQSIEKIAETAKGLERRNCYNDIITFLEDYNTNNVYILYGLRRTGKTTLALQVLMSEESKSLGKPAIIQLEKGDRISFLKNEIKKLYNKGIRVLLIDEATRALDLSNGGAILSDIFSKMGIKILLTGTDSLKFIFAKNWSLYDKTFESRTTFISFKEWLYLIKKGNLDTYIEYGGTLCYEYIQTGNEKFFYFSNPKSTYEYTDSAIAHNIQNSLKTERGGILFRELHNLYTENLLTGIINRIVERENHSMILDTIQRKFFPQDIDDGIVNIAKDTWRSIPDDFFSKVNIPNLLKNLMTSLSISNDITLQSVTSEQMDRLKEYLYFLDLFVFDSTYILRILPDGNPVCTEDKNCNICIQPGLRYNHAKTLVYCLSKDKEFQSLLKIQRDELVQMFLEMAKGRILEEIIRHETRVALKEYSDIFVYKIIFNEQENIPHGEYDMLIYDKEFNICQIYEVKHSKYKSRKYKHWLRKKSSNDLVEHFFGEITNKSIIYMGAEIDDEIRYINASVYLQDIEYYTLILGQENYFIKKCEEDPTFLKKIPEKRQTKKIVSVACESCKYKKGINPIDLYNYIREDLQIITNKYQGYWGIDPYDNSYRWYER